jgi:GH24 family phage-related lysozyme (muramidase)
LAKRFPINTSVIPEIRQKAMRFIERQEGRDACMYLDSEDNVTCGVGHLLSSFPLATHMPFFALNPERPATNEEKSLAWHALKHQANFVNKRMRWPGLVLHDEDINFIFDTDFDRIVLPVLYKTFPSFDSFPEDVQVGLSDMAFNMGTFEEFPRFTTAVNRQDWTGASLECDRLQVNQKRNAETADLFKQQTIA